MNDKKRLDLALKEKFNFSRQYIKNIIIKGKVEVNGKIILKPSFLVTESDILKIKDDAAPKYVGRGGLKLEKAVNEFKIDLNGMICIDIGSSTGGFTDCMLKNKAALVYAVDVGTNQLSESLREDKRVISMEKTDIRNVKDIPYDIDFIGTDVSFISLKKISKDILRLLKPNGSAVVLLKPQFEAGRENLSKGGIVKNSKIHKKIIKDIINHFNEIGLFVKALTYSPITGGDGNIEYLIYLIKTAKAEVLEFDLNKIGIVVDTAFYNLNGGLK